MLPSLTLVYQVDAFTDRAFRGNPAAVCLLSAHHDDAWMQAVAMEMNLSETAFVLPLEDGFSLRWFTPAVEVELCGHATLASAHVLWQSGVLGRGEIARFHTRSGLLTADLVEEGIRLDFPALEPMPCDALAGLLEGLGIHAEEVHCCGNKHLLRIRDEATLRALAPDFAALRRLPLRGVMVTAPADAGSPFDFVSRYFAPWVGIDEDPVTGSAHCCLAPYWAQRLGKKDLFAHQASARGGELRLRLSGQRVQLIGAAITTLRGELHC